MSYPRFDISHVAPSRKATIALAGLGAAATVALGAATAGDARAQTGGTVAPGNPVITNVKCLTLCIKPRVATIGSKIRINGEDLDRTRVVSLRRRDGRRAKDIRPRVKHQWAVIAYVKKGAASSPVRVADSFNQIRDSDINLKIGSKAQLRRVQQRFIFPVRGPHTYGDGMGAGRGHEGQDILASCGTRLVAAHTGRVINRSGSGPSGAAGNFVMIWNKRKQKTHVYMHLARPPRVRKGAFVSTGTKIGVVGSTGRSTGCHLHFEIRRGKGWFGTPINPTRALRYWDSYS